MATYLHREHVDGPAGQVQATQTTRRFSPGQMIGGLAGLLFTVVGIIVVVRTGIDSDPAHGAVIPPLYLSSNYSFDGLEGKRKYDYTRSGNPTRDVLAEALTELEEFRVWANFRGSLICHKM